MNQPRKKKQRKKKNKMSTGTKIILRALQAIGAHSVVSPASPASIELGMENLNSMLELWLDQDIQIGFTPLQAPGDELNEPLSARNIIIFNLAVTLAPNFDNGVAIVTPKLKAAADKGYNDLARLYKKISVPLKIPSSTLPKGQGNQRWGRGWKDNYFKKGEPLDG